MQQKPRSRWVAVNERGARVGDSHGRAVLSNHDVENLHLLLAERDELLAACASRRAGMIETQRVLHAARLSFGELAVIFEVSKTTIADIAHGRTRAQVPAKWKRV